MNNIDSTIEKVLKKAPQYTRFKRHALSLLSHSTPKKLVNLLAIELQRKIHRTKVVGYPYFLIIDPNNICNLRCPLCPSGFKETEMKREFVRIEDFKKIIDRLYPYAYEVALHNWGEPFLNPDIFEMIRYCKKKNIGTNLSTNLNISSLDTDEIIRSGLEYMVVSMDGTTQNVYSKYRVGGKIDLVFNNMVDLINKRKELKSKSPFIEWQYVVMKHNIHQIDDAKRMAKEIGVDTIRFIPVGLPIDAVNKDELAMEWFPYITSDSKENYIKDRFLQSPLRVDVFIFTDLLL